jgi:hypothetical protein
MDVNLLQEFKEDIILTGEENTAEIDEKLNQYFDSILTSLE